MSPIPTTRPTATTAASTARVRPEPTDRYRSRDVGTGYGTSSGYAANRRYSVRSDRAYFRWP